MLIEIANSLCTLKHSAGSPVSGGVFNITSIPSIKVKAEGYGVYRGSLSFSFSGGTASGFDPLSVTGTGAIPPTAIKVKADGQLVMRKGDSVIATMIGTISGAPTPIPGASVEIDNPGQTKVKGQ